MKKPNILFIMPDEFRQCAMGFMEQDPVVTPNIDNLAAEGLVLNNAVSCYPVCSPYRGQLFTGQYPMSNRILGNCNDTTAQFGVYLRLNQTCITDILSANGYNCGYVGKYHLDTPDENDYPYIGKRREDGKIWDAYTPPHMRHGMNFWYSYGCHDEHFTPHYWFNNDRVQEVRQIDAWAPEHEAEVVINYIENKNGAMRDENKPFIMFWAPNPPHMPFSQVPEKYKKIYENKTASELLTRPNALRGPGEEIPATFKAKAEAYRNEAVTHAANYFAAVTGIDKQVGRILSALESRGLSENTIVIFTSDHGEMMGSHSLMYKGLWYDECVKVPFIIRYPGIKTGQSDIFLNPPDIMPTLLELAEVAIPKGLGLEGRSLAAYMQNGGHPPRDEGYFINPSVNARGVMNHEYYLVVLRNSHEHETCILYDRINDPFQMKNIAPQEPELTAYMRDRLDEWLKNTKDIWVKSPAKYIST